MEPDLDGVLGEAEHAGRVVGGELLDVAEHQYRAVVVRQPADGFANPVSGLAPVERAVCGLAELLTFGDAVADLVELRKELLDRRLGPAPPRAQLHETGIDHDAVEPGRQARAAVKPLDRTEPREKPSWTASRASSSERR